MRRGRRVKLIGLGGVLAEALYPGRQINADDMVPMTVSNSINLVRYFRDKREPGIAMFRDDKAPV